MFYIVIASIFLYVEWYFDIQKDFLHCFTFFRINFISCRSFYRIIFRFIEYVRYIFFSRKLAWNRFPSASNLQVPPFFPHSFLMERIPIPSSPFSRFLE